MSLFLLFLFGVLFVSTCFCLIFFLMIRRPPRSTRTDTLVPYTTLFRSVAVLVAVAELAEEVGRALGPVHLVQVDPVGLQAFEAGVQDRKSTRLNSSH